MAFRLQLSSALGFGRNMFTKLTPMGFSAAHNTLAEASTGMQTSDIAEMGSALANIALDELQWQDYSSDSRPEEKQAAATFLPAPLTFNTPLATFPAIPVSLSKPDTGLLLPAAAAAAMPLAEPLPNFAAEVVAPEVDVKQLAVDKQECAHCLEQKLIKDFYKDNKLYCKPCLWTERSAPLDLALMKSMVTRYPQKAAKYGWTAADFPKKTRKRKSA